MLFFSFPAASKIKHIGKNTQRDELFFCAVFSFVWLPAHTHTHLDVCKHPNKRAHVQTRTYWIHSRVNAQTLWTHAHINMHMNNSPSPLQSTKKTPNTLKLSDDPYGINNWAVAVHVCLGGREGEREGDVKKKYCLWSDDICCSG